MRYLPSPVEREDLLPRYCGTCGRELVREHLGRYDRNTGAMLPGPSTAICPRWDERSDRHEAWIVSPKPPLTGVMA